MSHSLLSWQTPKYLYTQKSTAWFVVLFVTAGILTLFAIFRQSFLESTLYPLMALVIAIYGVVKPKTVKVEITAEGVLFDKLLYKYESLKSYSFIELQKNQKALSLRTRQALMPYVYIPLQKQDPAEIRSILSHFLSEEEHQESFFDALARGLGF